MTPLDDVFRSLRRSTALVDPLRRCIAEIAPTSAVHWTGSLVDEVTLECAPSRF